MSDDNEPDYVRINRANWDERAPAHARSDGYSLDRFRVDPTFLSGVVSFDLPLLGDISGLRGVHLQCHVGTDTVSLARLGARMSGLDFSPAALQEARALDAELGTGVSFHEAEVYDAPAVLGRGKFDLVYTGIGALCWLPDIDRWAAVVAELLAPGGCLFIREGHPVLWSLADARPDALLVIDYPYFEVEEALVWDDGGTYVDTDVQFTNGTSHEWNHGLGEIVTALIEHGLQVAALVEHDSVPWEAIPGQMEELPNGEFRLADRPERLPHSYTLKAVKTPS